LYGVKNARTFSRTWRPIVPVGVVTTIMILDPLEAANLLRRYGDVDTQLAAGVVG
jgi:hypothetical protein